MQEASLYTSAAIFLWWTLELCVHSFTYRPTNHLHFHRLLFIVLHLFHIRIWMSQGFDLNMIKIVMLLCFWSCLLSALLLHILSDVVFGDVVKNCSVCFEHYLPSIKYNFRVQWYWYWRYRNHQVLLLRQEMVHRIRNFDDALWVKEKVTDVIHVSALLHS